VSSHRDWLESCLPTIPIPPGNRKSFKRITIHRTVCWFRRLTCPLSQNHPLSRNAISCQSAESESQSSNSTSVIWPSIYYFQNCEWSYFLSYLKKQKAHRKVFSHSSKKHSMRLSCCDQENPNLPFSFRYWVRRLRKRGQAWRVFGITVISSFLRNTARND